MSVLAPAGCLALSEWCELHSQSKAQCHEALMFPYRLVSETDRKLMIGIPPTILPLRFGNRASIPLGNRESRSTTVDVMLGIEESLCM